MRSPNENSLIVQQSPGSFNFFDPQQFETMQRVSKMFANSELVPDMYKTSPTNPETKAMANCMIAISMSLRVGADPLMIMQNMVIIYGRPSWSSKFLIATVNTCGRFNPLQFRFEEKGTLGMIDYVEYEKVWETNQSTGKRYSKNIAKNIQFDGKKIMNIECVAYTTAKGSDQVLESSPVTVRMAIEEGWYTKNGSKWRTMTRQMLMYRAASFWTNAYAPEISMGMRTEDEVRDTVVDVDYVDVTEKVEREKSEKANKETIGFDQKGEDIPAEENTPEENAPGEQKQDQGTENAPGF